MISEEKIAEAKHRLNAEKLDFDTKNNDLHFIITDFKGSIINFWPTTGKWIAKNGPNSNGLNNLLRYIKDK